jgi:hypothetical protein
MLSNSLVELGYCCEAIFRAVFGSSESIPEPVYFVKLVAKGLQLPIMAAVHEPLTMLAVDRLTAIGQL